MAADFVVTGGNCSTVAPLQPSQSCTLIVTFTPSGTGARTATLTVTGSKGGIFPVQLSGTGVPLVEIQPGGVATTSVSPTSDVFPVAKGGLDFGAQTLNVAGNIMVFRAVVRGAAPATATTTTSSAVLATSTPPDFRNMAYNDGFDTTATNPCTGAALGLTASTGAATTSAATAWSAHTLTGDVNQPVWTCVFYIQFFPQTSKGDKTATVTVGGSASGTPVIDTLTASATGPLSLSPTTVDFGNVTNGDASANNPQSGITLTVGSGEAGVQVLTVQNNGTGNQGPLSVALAGTNAGDFGIVGDTCTTLTTPFLASGATCTIKVTFAPTSLGAKTATLTVTAGGTKETTNAATLTGNSNATAMTLTLTPVGTSTKPFDFLNVAQSASSAYQTFTIANPTGAALSGKLTYSVTGPFEIFAPASSSETYPTGACGDPNTKQVDAGTNCTIQVRFSPANSGGTGDTGVKNGVLTVTDANGFSPDPVYLTGTSTSQLTLSPTSIDFGSVAQNATAVQSLTLTNNGTSALTVTIPNLASGTAPLSILGVLPACIASSPLAAAASCILTYQYQGQTPGTVLGTTAAPLTITMTASATVSAAVKVTGKSVNPAHLALFGFDDLAGNPDPISFGNVQVSSGSGAFAVWFTNTGDVDATGISATVTANSEFAILTEGNTAPCGNTLKAGATCSVLVQLTPATSGASVSTKSGTLTLAGLGGVNSVQVPLSGLSHAAADTSVYADVVGSPNVTVATIGATAVGASPKVYYTLHNNGAGTVNFTVDAYDTLVGTTYSKTNTEFVVARETNGAIPACVATNIPANSTCQFSVTFTPAADATTDNGRKYRWATIVYGAAAGGAQIASVVGQVQTPPALVLTATSTAAVIADPDALTVDFGQILEQTSASFTFTITNSGQTATKGPIALVLDNTASYAQVSATTCSTTVALAGGAACTATVTVTGASGLHNGINATAKDALASGENSDSWELIVRVVQPAALTLSAPAITYGTPGTQAGLPGGALTITVLNGGATDTSSNRQTSGALNVTLSDAANFQVDTASSTCYSATDKAYSKVAAGSAGSCTIVVNFIPQTAGAKSTIVSVGATPGGATQTVTLTGTGLGDLTITPAGTATVPVAPGTFSITNNGLDPTGLLRETIAGTSAAAFVITADSCYGQTLAAGDVCTVTVSFVGTSSATTAQTATLTVSDGKANDTVSSVMSVGGPA
jgi:hypothetical protein